MIISCRGASPESWLCSQARPCLKLYALAADGMRGGATCTQLDSEVVSLHRQVTSVWAHTKGYTAPTLTTATTTTTTTSTLLLLYDCRAIPMSCSTPTYYYYFPYTHPESDLSLWSVEDPACQTMVQFTQCFT